VIATDSYFLSNEALRRDRHPDLLAWLVGPGRHVVFDEAHLGVAERPGVATLMRQYRLFWLVAGLVLLAGLFIWKHSVSLLPAEKNWETGDSVPGKDAASGFVNLLRRSIPPGDLMRICFVEWRRTAATSGTCSRQRLERAEAAFNALGSTPAKGQEVVSTYQLIQKALQQGGPRPAAAPSQEPAMANSKMIPEPGIPQEK
jgi:hypothetical protein